MTNIVNNYSTTIISIYQDVIKQYERNEEDIKRIEGELSDLLHEIELSPSKDMYKGYKLYKEIRELRVERRRCKDENELLKDTYEYFKSQQGQGFKIKMQQLQGGAAKIYAKQERRTYTPRQRTDLTITDKHCEANKPFEDLLKDFNNTKVEVQKGKFKK